MHCKQITTFSANGKAFTHEKSIAVTLESDEIRHLESGVLNIYPEILFQEIEGFGGAMTEASAYLLTKMEANARKAALKEFFGRNSNQLTYLRVPIDSCDFSLEEYAAVEDPLSDPELNTFSLKRDQMYIIPTIKEAIQLSEYPLSVLLSPWSPPACWKTPPEKPKNDDTVYGNIFGFEFPAVDYEKPSRCNGGHLKPEYYASWAKYLVKFIQGYLAEGIPVTMLSIQNESNAATFWDSCVWTAAEQKTFLRDYLYPEFESAGLTEKVGIYIWDHNKERVLEYAMEIIDNVTEKMIEGIGFHWYAGDHFEAVEMTGRKYPGKTLLMSECCGLHKPGRVGFMDQGKNHKTPETIEYEDAVAYAHDIIGNLNAGMNRWIDWNLCVDNEGGPRHVPDGFTACMIVNEDGTYRKNLTYDYIGHFSRYISPGAVRIGHSSCDDMIEMTVAKNENGSISAVFLNKNNDDQQYAIRIKGHVIRIQLPARTISTIVITK